MGEQIAQYQGIDSITNDEYEHVIAHEDAIVKVDYNGGEVERVVKAGQQVPPDIVDAYQEQHGKAQTKPEVAAATGKSTDKAEKADKTDKD